MIQPARNCEHGLPGIDELPGADLVIYDGNCQFCQNQVRRLARWDGRGRLACMSLHDSRINQFVPDLTHDQLMREILVITQTGKRFAGVEAFRYLTRRLPKLWLFAPLIHIPFSLPFWKLGYRIIAHHRYRWNKPESGEQCTSGQCEVHLPSKTRR